MKYVSTLIVIFFALSAWSAESDNTETNKVCSQVYKVGVNKLIDLIMDYKDGKIKPAQMAVLASGVSAEVNSVALYCKFAASPAAKTCSQRYEEIYDDVSSRIGRGALLMGNQTEVDASMFYIARIQAEVVMADSLCKMDKYL